MLPPRTFPRVRGRRLWTPAGGAGPCARAPGIGIGFGRPFGGGFSPLLLPSLAFWYDLADGGTVFSDTSGTTPAADLDPIGRVNDKSGNGRHIQQATGSQRPTRDASVSPSAAFFDGGDRLISSATFGPIAQPYSLAIVTDNTANSAMLWDSGSAGTRQTAARGASATEVGFFAGSVVTRTGVPDMSVVRAWIFVYNGASSQVWCYDAGTAAFVQQGANGNAGANTLAEMRLGGNSVNFLQSTRTGEVVAWGAAASAGERAALGQYLATKWSLT
jgi:hypothetical protein